MFNEYTHALITDNGKENPGLVATGYQTALVEVMGLLMNPEVSKGLSLQTQKEVGPLFNNLFKFFSSIEISDNDIEKRCDYINLCFSGSIKEEELLNLEKKYALEEVV